MRLWNLCVSIAVLALASACWRFGDWTAYRPDNASMDGTCQGIQQLFAYFVALVLAAFSIYPLFVRMHDIDRWLEAWNAEPQTSGDEAWKARVASREGKDYDGRFE